MCGHGPQVRLSRYAVWGFLTFIGMVIWSTPVLAGAGMDPLVGRKLYMTHCYTCHGVTGKGDGPAAARLQPKPRNLTDDAYMSRKTDQDLYNVISGGSAALHRFSGMPDWKAIFYPERIWDVVAYLRTLHRPREVQEPLLVQPGNVESGQRVYADYCAVCHGKEGQGDGPIVAMFGPKPFAFTDKAGMAARRDQDLYFAIFNGGEAIGQSAFMPAWGGLLKASDISDVIAYIRTLAQ
ncbi:MAG TPA: c-type cytochrome [Candidatus Tectomicrobia bacterium]